MQQVDAAVDARLLRRGLERGRELRAAPTRGARAPAPCRWRPSRPRRRRRAGTAPRGRRARSRARARPRRPLRAEAGRGSCGTGRAARWPPDPIGGGARSRRRAPRGSARAGGGAPRTRSSAAGAGDGPARGDGVARPVVERLDVRLARRVARRSGATCNKQVVDGARPSLVALDRELVRRGPQRLRPARAEDALRRLAHVDEVEAAAHRGEARSPARDLEARVGAGHLPRLDGAQAHRALGGAGVAHEQVVHGGGEPVVADLRRRPGDTRSACVRHRPRHLWRRIP